MVAIPLVPTGIKPFPRIMATSVLVGNKLYSKGIERSFLTSVVFGGTHSRWAVDQTLCEFNISIYPQDVVVLTVGSNRSSQVVTKEAGTWAPYGHTMNHIGSKLYVFGGIGRHIFEGSWEECLLDEMSSLDLLAIDKPGLSWKVVEVDDKPAARSNHVSVTWKEGGKLIMCAPSEKTPNMQIWRKRRGNLLQRYLVLRWRI